MTLSKTVFLAFLSGARNVRLLAFANFIATIMPSLPLARFRTVLTFFSAMIAVLGRAETESPSLTVLAGDGQAAAPGAFNAKPFDVAVWNQAGTQPVVGAEVTFSVAAGGGLLSPSNTVGSLPAETLTLKTDEDGTVKAYYQQPLAYGILSEVKASCGTTQVILHTSTVTLIDGDATHGSLDKSMKSKIGAGSRAAANIDIAGLNGTSLAKTSAVAAIRNHGHPITLNAAQLKLRVPDKVYAVATSTWAISAVE